MTNREGKKETDREKSNPFFHITLNHAQRKNYLNLIEISNIFTFPFCEGQATLLWPLLDSS